jgi:hypothetical protein
VALKKTLILVCTATAAVVLVALGTYTVLEGLALSVMASVILALFAITDADAGPAAAVAAAATAMAGSAATAATPDDCGPPANRRAIDVQLAATYQGTRYLERRLKRWHKTGQFCTICREHRGDHAR